MRNASLAAASHLNAPQTFIGRELARRDVDLILAVEDGNALIQCQVSSAVAARMLAPLKGKAIGHFRALSDNLVEIDTLVTLPMAVQMLEAKAASSAFQLH